MLLKTPPVCFGGNNKATEIFKFVITDSAVAIATALAVAVAAVFTENYHMLTAVKHHQSAFL